MDAYIPIEVINNLINHVCMREIVLLLVSASVHFGKLSGATRLDRACWTENCEECWNPTGPAVVAATYSGKPAARLHEWFLSKFE